MPIGASVVSKEIQLALVAIGKPPSNRSKSLLVDIRRTKNYAKTNGYVALPRQNPAYKCVSMIDMLKFLESSWFGQLIRIGSCDHTTMTPYEWLNGDIDTDRIPENWYDGEIHHTGGGIYVREWKRDLPNGKTIEVGISEVQNCVGVNVMSDDGCIESMIITKSDDFQVCYDTVVQFTNVIESLY